MSLQRGFSLVELMVALVAGLVVTTAVVAFTLSTMKSNGEYIQATRVTQELRNTLNLVTRELRRAGYDETSMGLLGKGSGSPFAHLLLDNPVTVSGDDYATCVVYAYDRADGTAGSRDVDRGEVRAIRWMVRDAGNGSVGVMEFAESADGTTPECDGDSPDYTQYPVACNDDSHWCALSDPKVLEISQFLIHDDTQILGTGTSQISMRDLSVTLRGRNVGTTDTERTVQSNVRVRTDCFDPTITNCEQSP